MEHITFTAPDGTVTEAEVETIEEANAIMAAFFIENGSNPEDLVYEIIPLN